LGRLDDAERELQAAMPIASTDLDTAYTLAHVAVDRGRKDEARQLLETGLKNPQSSMFRQESEELLKELKK
jgi:thioredoxin-like negative regulator of GroEL